MGKFLYKMILDGKVTYVVESSSEEALDLLIPITTKGLLPHATPSRRSEVEILLVAEATDIGYTHLPYGILYSNTKVTRVGN